VAAEFKIGIGSLNKLLRERGVKTKSWYDSQTCSAWSFILVTQRKIGQILTSHRREGWSAAAFLIETGD